MLSALRLVAVITCATDGGVVVEADGFRWTLPDDARFDVSYDAGVYEEDWGRGAAGRHWNAKLPDESLWQLTRWSVPNVTKGLSAKSALQRWRGSHDCVSTMLDGGVAVPNATMQFAHRGSCKGGDVYARRVAVFMRDGGAVIYEFDAVRLLTTWDPVEPRVPLSASLDAFVRSVELR